MSCAASALQEPPPISTSGRSAPDSLLRTFVISAVLGAVDGQRTFGEIVAKLAQDFAAPSDRIATDARKFLGELINRRMLEAT